MILPSYNEAIRPLNVPSLIVPYLDLRSQRAASLVSRSWYKAVQAHLWADPLRTIARTSHPFYHAAKLMHNRFTSPRGTRNEITTMNYPSLLVCQHVPALRKEFAYYELLFGFNWIFQNGSLFPNLRFIILDGLERAGEIEENDDSQLAQSANSRVLLLSAKNVSFGRLERFIITTKFPDLMYLDLSYSCRPEDLALFGQPNNLRILKLRGLRLARIPDFVLRLGKRLWSLDIRDNLITDNNIVPLLDQVFATTFPALPQTDESIEESVDNIYVDPPVYHRLQSGDTYCDHVPLRPDSIKTFTKYITDNGNLQKNSLIQILSPDDALYVRTGLTQLYISANRLSSETVAKILTKRNRLQVLDVGTVRLESVRTRFQTAYAIGKVCDKITPLSGCRLRRLRVHHSAVTRIPTLVRSNSTLGFDLQALKQAEETHEDDGCSFNPLHHNRLTSLTLTDVPTKSYGPIISRLTDFLLKCAVQEQRIAANRSAMPQHRRVPQLLEGLRTLRLEFLPLASESSTVSGSVSGDRDADSFLASSMGDFSFFGGSSATEQAGKDATTQMLSHAQNDDGIKDVVQELRRFRHAQKPEGWKGTLELAWPSGH